jgi:hypothetical protein
VNDINRHDKIVMDMISAYDRYKDGTMAAIMSKKTLMIGTAAQSMGWVARHGSRPLDLGFNENAASKTPGFGDDAVQQRHHHHLAPINLGFEEDADIDMALPGIDLGFGMECETDDIRDARPSLDLGFDVNHEPMPGQDGSSGNAAGNQDRPPIDLGFKDDVLIADRSRIDLGFEMDDEPLLGCGSLSGECAVQMVICMRFDCSTGLPGQGESSSSAAGTENRPPINLGFKDVGFEMDDDEPLPGHGNQSGEYAVQMVICIRFDS